MFDVEPKHPEKVQRNQNTNLRFPCPFLLKPALACLHVWRQQTKHPNRQDTDLKRNDKKTPQITESKKAKRKQKSGFPFAFPFETSSRLFKCLVSTGQTAKQSKNHCQKERQKRKPKNLCLVLLGSLSLRVFDVEPKHPEKVQREFAKTKAQKAGFEVPFPFERGSRLFQCLATTDQTSKQD